MNKLITIAIGIVILVAIASFYFFKPSVTPAKTAEEQAFSIVDQELQQAIESITDQDIENALIQ